MFEPRDFETPCPDNAHGTPLESAQSPRNDTPSGNPDTSTAQRCRHGRTRQLCAGDGIDCERAHAALTAQPAGTDGRRACCEALLAGETVLALPSSLEIEPLAGAAANVLRGLRHAIAAGALPDADAREDALCELGAAASLVLEALDATDGRRNTQPEFAAAIALLREQYAAAFEVARG